jgi:Retroviral aspartyl protease
MMTIDILISGESLGQKKIVETITLLDTGAGEKFIDQNFVRNQKIETKELKYPIEVFNVDGTTNKWGTITKYTQLDLTINGQTWTHNLLVTGLGKRKIILGYPWFKQTNQPRYQLEGMHTYLANKTGQKKTHTQTNNWKWDWSRRLEKSYCQSDWRIGRWTNWKCSFALLHWGGKIKGLDQCKNQNSHGTSNQGKQKESRSSSEKFDTRRSSWSLGCFW